MALILIIIGSVVLIAGLVIIAKLCSNVVHNTGIPSHSAVKIGLIAVGPVIFMGLGLLKISIPIFIPIIILVAALAVTAIWNIKSYNVPIGIMFTVLHLAVGIVAGISIVSLIFAIVAVVVATLFVGGSEGSSKASGAVPESLYDPATGETFDVSVNLSGTIELSNGTLIRPSDYPGRYIDDNGNSYVVTH